MTFFKGKFSHCGVNVFHFKKETGGWKITSIDDTRRKNYCMGEMKAKADVLLDQWHAAAARADSTAYFDALSDDAIFIGTDSSEVWNKTQFLNFAAPYFKKGKAWDFCQKSAGTFILKVNENLFGLMKYSIPGWVPAEDPDGFQFPMVN